MKEPGQIAYEAWQAHTGFWSGWDRRRDDDKAQWARVEAAIRADERASVIEECAKVAAAEADDANSTDARKMGLRIIRAIRGLANPSPAAPGKD